MKRKLIFGSGIGCSVPQVHLAARCHMCEKLKNLNFLSLVTLLRAQILHLTENATIGRNTTVLAKNEVKKSQARHRKEDFSMYGMLC
jgi:hypothetical protein